MSNKLKSILATGQAWIAVGGTVIALVWYVGRIEWRLAACEHETLVLSSRTDSLTLCASNITQTMHILTNQLDHLRFSMDELIRLHNRTN